MELQVGSLPLRRHRVPEGPSDATQVATGHLVDLTGTTPSASWTSWVSKDGVLEETFVLSTGTFVLRLHATNI